ncbi:hypothetical protein MFLAVUS_009495 [Mucor flavus]|uniref:Uncharacterized protein n=1 Tax=Mucor flavus TaxID=439312 RepID=A0ABP9ZA64_9FUNG
MTAENALRKGFRRRKKWNIESSEDLQRWHCGEMNRSGKRCQGLEVNFEEPELLPSFGVQTSLDFSDEDQRAELVECIRPLLLTIRNTPYGKRIHKRLVRLNKKWDALGQFESFAPTKL